MTLRRTLLTVGLLGSLGFAAWTRRADLAAFDWRLDPLLLGAAALLLAVPGLVQAWTWLVALRRVGAAAARGEALRVWARSWLLRYEPSGAVGFAYRVTARERLGATTPQVLTATGYEQLAAVVGGAVAAPLGFVAAGVAVPWPAWLAAAGAVALGFAVRPAWLGGWVVRRLAARGIGVAPLLRGRVLLALVLAHAVGWAATCWSVALLAAGMGVDAHAGVLLGAAALAWLAGVLVPLAPGGLGVRDAALAVGLAPVVGVGAATSFAIGLRVVGFAGELVSYAAAEALALVRRRQAPAPVRQRGQAPLSRGGRAVVVVPTYDEVEALPLFVERFAATGMDLLIVDDDSPDGTGALADELAATTPWMHVLHRPGKEGLGVAYRAGFAWCLERGYDVIGQMDVDLSHPPEKLAELRAVLEERDADLVLGSRYAPGGGTDGWSRTRLALSRVGCTMSRLVLGLPYGDLSGGFKLWRASCLRDLGLDGMLSTGYAFQVETTQLAHLLGKRIEEVPFVFSERVAGESKMTLAISLEGIRVCLRLRRRAARFRTA